MAITATRIDEEEEKSKLSVGQVERICQTLYKLNEHTEKANMPNALVITLVHNLKMSKTTDEKRKWIVMFFTNAFQLLSFINMAKSDKMMELSNNDYEIELKMLFREKE
jgi:hypothetical protein